MDSLAFTQIQNRCSTLGRAVEQLGAYLSGIFGHKRAGIKPTVACGLAAVSGISDFTRAVGFVHLDLAVGKADTGLTHIEIATFLGPFCDLGGEDAEIFGVGNCGMR